MDLFCTDVFVDGYAPIALALYTHDGGSNIGKKFRPIYAIPAKPTIVPQT
jgi:hypothetical protein